MKTGGVKKSPDPTKVDSIAKANGLDGNVENTPGMVKEMEAVNSSSEEGEGQDGREGEGGVEGEGEGEGKYDLEMDSKEDDADDADDENEDELQEGKRINEEEGVDAKGTVGIQEAHPEVKSIDENRDEKLLAMQYFKEINEKRKKKQPNVCIDNLSKEATEEDIRAEFERIGTVTEVRLIQDLQNGKAKGSAFVHYADPLDALKAVEELNALEVHGQPCRVVLNEENILYLGNVARDWKNENVIKALKKYEVQGFEDVILIEDPQDKECHLGFGFLEFSTHKEALHAYKKLQKPDAVFGCERSAKVAWAQLWNEPEDSVMSQVRTVFLNGVPSDWDEQKLKEQFGVYGEIENIDGRKGATSSRKRKFWFIKYATREGAMSCIEAINNFEVSVEEQVFWQFLILTAFVNLHQIELCKVALATREFSCSCLKAFLKLVRNEQVKLTAELAKPLPNRKGLRRGIRGGFPIPQNIVDQEGGETGKEAVERASTIGSQQESQKPKKKFFERTSATVPHSGTFLQSQGRAAVRQYAPDGRKEPRGRKRTFSDLGQGPRYADILHQNARVQLVRTENVQYIAVPGPQYARVPYFESSQRVPVGGVAQYAVLQSVPLMPATTVHRQPTYAVYGTSSTPIYSPGSYSYAQIDRGGTYITPPYDGQNNIAGSVHYSLPALNRSAY